MLRRNLASLIVAGLAAVAVTACSHESPVAPNSRPEGLGDESVLAAQPVPGSYELFFLNEFLEPVSSLPVGEFMILKAHVETSSGPAQGGRVYFQYCRLKGVSSPNGGPTAACDDAQLATWANFTTSGAPVNESGDAFVPCCLGTIPHTIGFRCFYRGQGSGVANGMCAARDFIFVAAS